MHTFSKVSIDTHVSSCARQAFMFSIRNMLVGVGINVFLCKTKIYDENSFFLLTATLTNQKVLWLNVTINEQL